jgi:hypothetical protein
VPEIQNLLLNNPQPVRSAQLPSPHLNGLTAPKSSARGGNDTGRIVGGDGSGRGRRAEGGGGFCGNGKVEEEEEGEEVGVCARRACLHDGAGPRGRAREEGEPSVQGRLGMAAA